MSAPISNHGRMTPPNTSLRGALDKTPAASASTEEVSATAATPPTNSTTVDQLRLSHVTEKAMAQPDFDRAKVDAIKQALKNGNYPLDPRRIAQGFVSLESMISN